MVPRCNRFKQMMKGWGGLSGRLAQVRIYFARHPDRVQGPGIIFFPCRSSFLSCGLAGIVAFKRASVEGKTKDCLKKVAVLVDRVAGVATSGLPDVAAGEVAAAELMAAARLLKQPSVFAGLFGRTDADALLLLWERLAGIVGGVHQRLADMPEQFGSENAVRWTALIEVLKDAAWCLKAEVHDNVGKVQRLMGADSGPADIVAFYRELNAVLNSIDRLEVRGRDSAGLSLLFFFSDEGFAVVEAALAASEGADGRNLLEILKRRCSGDVLLNRCVGVRRGVDADGRRHVGLTLTYKVAAEIGSLGDNIRFLRDQIATDEILKVVVRHAPLFHTISSHTRWASVGAINEGNCHPVDNRALGKGRESVPIIHACLNGDIDNYLKLRGALAEEGIHVPEEITTDTKIIPLQVEKYIRAGADPLEAFRRAVNDFEGSHAIAMQTDLAPGKLFLAQRGSGQAVFVGLADSHYMPSSEVYGFVEETSRYLKLDGEKVVPGKNGDTQGQIFVLDQGAAGGIDGISGLYYDGTPFHIDASQVHHTDLTSRDIDRQGYPHYFLKEISESPDSVAKTLQNRWMIATDGEKRYRTVLDETVVCSRLRQALRGEGGLVPIRRIFFIGQGTAGVAALACANIMNTYLDDPRLYITALKASEMSGFRLGAEGDAQSMADCLVVAISQSGTTTDTNRTVDMVKALGAHTLAIVNRRDSDLTFKTDGVLYTSSGRDIEMSVASTKAFYSQIIAGALLALNLAEMKGRRGPEFVAQELKRLLAIPDQMRQVLATAGAIEQSAKRLAQLRTYWAVVGSGPNKAAADEIRIKLSELCYKTISSDYVEDKKHIDLSSEPLIIVCAAGTKENVLGDIIKDTAIFKAHKAAPVVIADEGEERFAPYAQSVFHVPAAAPHLAPILNTLAGHLWGYYAALAINESSRFLFQFREGIRKTIDAHAEKGLDIFEMVLEKTFREAIADFYNQFRLKRYEKNAPTPISMASDLILLLKYLSGRLPASDFELDFNKKGTARNMLDTLFTFMGESINAMARPIDAIKHQAKTVTVGTSRISEKVEGILFDALADFGIGLGQVTTSNIVVLKNLQGIVSVINGAILYHIDGMDLLGEPTDETTIHIVRKTGVLAAIPSRVEADNRLKGTKRIIAAQGNVYIGKGRKDGRSILVIPVISSSPEKPNVLENMLLLNIGFRDAVPLAVKTKALGGKYEHIKNIVQENSLPWDDGHLDLVPMADLFGISAEKIGEAIVSRLT